MTQKERIIETAKNILMEHGQSMQYAELLRQVLERCPDLQEKKSSVGTTLVDWKNQENEYLKSLEKGEFRWPPPETDQPEKATSLFTWVPIYRQIAEKVLEYRDRQDKLIDILQKLHDDGIKTIRLVDHVGEHEKKPLKEIDPFTFFASFNRGMKREMRRKIIEGIQKGLGLEVRAPDDFRGIPTVRIFQTWFFDDKVKGREDGDIPLLWDFAEAAMKNDNERLEILFPNCLKVRRVKTAKLTIGLFWLAAENYVSLDKQTIPYYKEKYGVEFSTETWRDYADSIRKVRAKTNEPFYKISHDAYLAGQGGGTPPPSLEPTVEEYVNALQSLLEQGTMSDNIKRCLAAWQESPMTMTMMSKFLGYKTEKSIRLPLGKFAKSIGEILDKDKSLYPRRGVRLFASGERDPQQNNEYVHTLRPNFRSALEKFPLSDWAKLTVNPPGVPQGNPIFDRIDELLEHKKQVILYGPPGTGKTYWANRYVNEWTGEDDPDSPYIARCTFHPEYGYEHFIEGFKPELDENGHLAFRLRNGVFKNICQAAAEEPDQSFYLIIDEINRGDIPRIFGELITLIESDKRNESFAVRLPHSGKLFHVPDNVYIIATMNTTDRSIALLDTALRRRFGFIEMVPDPAVLGNRKVGEVHVGEWLKKLNEKLVEELKKIRSDAKHVKIGHSYLMPKGEVVQTREQLERIVEFEILPLLEEYCYEANHVFETLKGHIKKSLNMPIQENAPGQETSPEVSSEPPTVDDMK